MTTTNAKTTTSTGTTTSAAAGGTTTSGKADGKGTGGKARTVRTTKTPEQRRAEADALQARIVEQVGALQTSDGWLAFLTASRTLHRYSLGNVLLAMSQRPEGITLLGGYRFFQGQNRQVRRGEAGLRILAMRDDKTTTTDKTTTDKATADKPGRTSSDKTPSSKTPGEETTTRGRRCFPVTVFDILQTVVVDADRPDPLGALAGLDGAGEAPVRRLSGADGAGIFDAVADFLAGRGWSVERELIGGQVNGYTTVDGTRRVVVDSGLSAAHAAKTGLHEAAHVLLHAETDPASYAHRGTAEVEAESVAYVVAGLLGLDASAYSVGYVAGWAGGDLDLVRATAARVLRAVHTLADALTAGEDTAADADTDAEQAAGPVDVG